ncbi:Argonaute1, partial [Globisporangium splendens]
MLTFVFSPCSQRPEEKGNFKCTRLRRRKKMSSRGGRGHGGRDGSRGAGSARGRGSAAPGRGGGRGAAAPGRGGGRGTSAGAAAPWGGNRGAPPAPPSAPPSTAPPPAPARAAPPAQVDTLGSELEEKLDLAAFSDPSSTQLVTPTVQMHFPPRPGFGRAGTPVKILANHFQVNFNPRGDVYHYDVAFAENGNKFSNDGPPKTLAAKIMQSLVAQMKREFPSVCIVSDGRKNLYSPSRLPFEEQEFTGLKLADEDRPKEYSAVVKEADPVAIRMEQLNELFAGNLNYTPQDALQALDIAMRHTASTRFTVVGRNLFGSAGKKDIGEGADVWFGYFQSLRATQSKLVLNLDLAATAFVKNMSAIDYVRETLGLHDLPTSLNRYQHGAFNKAISGVKVEITHRPGVRRAYRVNKLSTNGADQTFFQDDNGNRVSIQSYFASTYNLRLRYPRLPCLHVGARDKGCYLPIEVCNIMAGQKCPRKATDTQVANMIRFTCTNPQDRKRSIETKFREAGFDRDPTLQAFGLNVNSKMVEMQGRLLAPPNMAYKNGTIRPDTGVWNMKGKSFFQAAKLNSWSVISCCDPRRNPMSDMEKFFRAVISQMGQLGMDPPKNLPPIIVKPRNESVRRAFDEAIRAATSTFGVKPQIVWVINPTTDATAYGDLKRASDTELGVVSQCMLAKHIQKCNPQYIANILQKVNTKLGGKNAVIAENLPKLGRGTIVFGADVTHPSPMDRTRPSVAAVVASMDQNFIKHAASIRAQGHRVEQITNLKDMVVDLMKRFYRETRSKPERIVFYRDGVSEGQFRMVLNHEVTAIREACATLEKGYMPPITFIIVQKRHNTRLFPSDPKTGDRSGNVKAGTVVDRAICHPVENDFYLMSHAGLQGTSRPTHYHVLLDEIGFTADEIQGITYKLCYTFARCTRSVSMVPSAYYSHLVAFRARFFQLDGSDTASMRSGSSESGYDVDTRMLEVHDALKQVMFYV